MRAGPYMSVGADPEKMSPLPRLVHYNSMLLGLGSLAAAFVYKASSSDDSSLDVFIGLGVFGCIALVSGIVSGNIYEKQKRKLGMGNYRTEKGKFYDRIFRASAFVATSSFVSSIPLLFGCSLEASCSAIVLVCLSIGAMVTSGELRDYANSYKPQRRAVLRLLREFNREEEGYEDSIGRRVLLSNSNPGYGSIKTTTKL